MRVLIICQKIGYMKETVYHLWCTCTCTENSKKRIVCDAHKPSLLVYTIIRMQYHRTPNFATGPKNNTCLYSPLSIFTLCHHNMAQCLPLMAVQHIPATLSTLRSKPCLIIVKSILERFYEHA